MAAGFGPGMNDAQRFGVFDRHVEGVLSEFIEVDRKRQLRADKLAHLIVHRSDKRLVRSCFRIELVDHFGWVAQGTKSLPKGVAALQPHRNDDANGGSRAEKILIHISLNFFIGFKIGNVLGAQRLSRVLQFPSRRKNATPERSVSNDCRGANGDLSLIHI